MARLNARYRHFYASGKRYQHFWANFPDANASGATLTVTASIVTGVIVQNGNANGATLTATVSPIAGAAHGNANASGVTLLDAYHFFPGTASGSSNASGEILSPGLSLIDGVSSSDASVPINTRLNARYRHFYNRRQQWRHFWAQTEGAGITLVLPAIIIAAALLTDEDGVSGDANAQGHTLDIDASIINGVPIVITPGRVVTATTEIVNGDVSADVLLPGDTVTVTTSILQGTFVPGAVLPVSWQLIAGDVSAAPTAQGETLNVEVELLAGIGSASYDALGDDFQVDVSLIDGETFINPPDVFNIGEIMVVFVGIVERGDATGENNHADVSVDGATLTAHALISSEGTATGGSEGPPVEAPIRTGGPIGYQSKTPQPESKPGFAFGSKVTSFAAIISGYASGDTFQPDVPSIVPAMPTVEVEEIELPRSKQTAGYVTKTGLTSGAASVKGAALDGVIDHSEAIALLLLMA